MGMYFNTPATVRTLAILNTVFNKAGLRRIRDEGVWADNYQQLPGAHGTYATFGVPLGFDHDDATLSKNWSDWLTNIFDKELMPDNLTIIATAVGQALNNAITDPNCVQIEFFGVPQKTGITATIISLPEKQKPTYSLIVTITTTTKDVLLAAARRRSRQQGG